MTRGEWFATRGYVLCRLDVRGTGSSGGVALDEYTADETRDGYDAVEWLAAQPWCDGAVAMWGISYGGFTAIQVAALRPPHLRAIVPVMATDDRYLDDVHYRGGCVTVSELSQYAVSQVAMNAMPAEAAFRGAAWREEWLARLEATPPWLYAWLRHQTDGPYWRQGSLAPDYDAIEAAILNIGGWNDSYVDPAFRMQARCPAPSHTIVGNWHHSWPHDASARPEPRRAARDRSVPGSPPAGQRQRLGRRAAGRLVRTRVRPAGALPGAVARTLAGGGRLPAPRDAHPCVRLRRRRRAPGRAAGPAGDGRCVDRRRRRSGGRRRLRAPADRRHARRPVLGRRRRTERPRPRPAPRRGRRPDVHLPAPGRGTRDPRRPRRGRPPGGRCARRDPVGATRRRRARRHGRVGERRRPEPDPSSIACEPRTDAARCRRGDPRAAADRRLSMAPGPPDPRRAGVLAVAGPLAIAVPRHVRSPSRSGGAVPTRAAGHPARRWPGRCGRAGLPHGAARPALADGRGARSAPARLAPIHRSGGSTRT